MSFPFDSSSGSGSSDSIGFLVVISSSSPSFEDESLLGNALNCLLSTPSVDTDSALGCLLKGFGTSVRCITSGALVASGVGTPMSVCPRLCLTRSIYADESFLASCFEFVTIQSHCLFVRL